MFNKTAHHNFNPFYFLFFSLNGKAKGRALPQAFYRLKQDG